MSVPASRSRPSSDRPPGAAALLAAAIFFVALINLNIPYYAITPGPAEDVGKLIVIKGAKTTGVKGKLLLTTVSLHEIRVGEAVRGWFDPTFEILSRAAIIPSGESEQDIEQLTTQQMTESQRYAAAAALRLLGYQVKVTPTGVRVGNVFGDVPAFKILHRGDVIVEAEGKPVRRAEDLVSVINHHKVGESVGLKILRGGAKIDVSAPTVARPGKPAEPVIGIADLTEVPDVSLPLAIQFRSLGIGGPSAGLMYALGVYDLLESGDLTGNRIIAGTGEIGLNGEVGPVGGVHQKIEGARRAGAQLFLVPQGELAEACRDAKGLPVIGVTSLREAIAVLRNVDVARARSCP